MPAARTTGHEKKKRRRGHRHARRPPKARRPAVVVLGTGSTARRLVAYLDRAGLARVHLRDPGSVDEAMDGGAPALVVIHPLEGRRTSGFLAEKATRHGDAAILVAHSEPLSDAMARSLYRAGAAAVLHWPHDRKALVRTLLRVIDHDASSATQKASDLVIEESVNEVLRHHRMDIGRLSCNVFDGVAILRGEVDALWKAHEAEDIVSEIDGVEDVVGRSLLVTGMKVDDRSIRRSLEQVTRAAAEIDPSTLAFRVDDGHVTIAGTASDRAELGRLLKVVRYVRGTKSVRNLVVVSGRAKRRDQALARRLRKAITIRHPRHRIEVSVFGGMVVLTGRCRSASLRRGIVELAMTEDGVIRVVDRMK